MSMQGKSLNIGFVTDMITSDMAGIGRYSKNVFEALCSIGHKVTPIDWREASALSRILETVPEKCISIPNRWPVTKSLLWHAFLFVPLAKYLDEIDVVFDPSQMLHPVGRLPKPFVYVVHDVTFMYLPECHKRGKKTINTLFLKNTLAKAEQVICVSKYTEQQLMHYFPARKEKISVIYEGAEAYFCPEGDQHDLDRVKRKYSLPDQFLLYVGTVEPRKNLDRLFRAYREHRDQITLPLYIAGKTGWRSKDILKHHEELGLQQQVKFLEYVPNADLAQLYKLATALVYISINEGFGLPPLEAMQSGLPVLVSDGGSLPEIAGDAALLTSYENQKVIGRSLARLCDDAQLRERLKEKGLKRAKNFSWKKTAEKLSDIFEALVRK